MATPGTSHVDPAFIGVFGETLEMLRTVALTKTGQPFVLSGSGTLGIADSSGEWARVMHDYQQPFALLETRRHLPGWDLVVSNLMESGDSALIINTGYFGDRFGEWYEVSVVIFLVH